MIRRLTILALLGLPTTIPMRAMGMASAEFYSTQAHTYGRFEARIQHAPGDGVVSSFFLWKEGSEVAGAYWNEIDFEKVGANCEHAHQRLLRQTAANHAQINPMPGKTCAEYHDYRIEWTPTYIAWSVDGSEFRRDTGDTATAFSQNASAGMTMHFNLWPGNSSFGGNINNTTLPVHEYISWVQYSSYDNGKFPSAAARGVSGFHNSGGLGSRQLGLGLQSLDPQSAERELRRRYRRVVPDRRQCATGNPGTPPADDGTSGTSNDDGGTGNTASSTGGSSGTGSGSSGGCAMMSFSPQDCRGFSCILIVAVCLVLGRTRWRDFLTASRRHSC
jgi:endo-1,3-1,4-beta-glycanase ExoK